MNQDLHAFVRDALAQGIGRERIAGTLRQAGWRQEEIEAELSGWAEGDFPVPVPRRRAYLSAREAFLYLVLFATLYSTAVNSGAVLFQVIDRQMPDPSQHWETARASVELARVATAGLIISFPIFLLLSSVIGGAVRRDPAKRASKIRKWLTYVTLFVAAMVILGDLTFLATRLLSGEIVARVMLKTLVVLGISGVVFSHYLADLRAEERGAAPALAPRLPPRVAAAGVVAVLALGLLTAGSPRRERLRRLDAERVGDLQAIARQMRSWTVERRRLPESLEALAADPASPPLRLRDPATRRPYEYRTLDSLHYELCAAFDTVDSLTSDAGPGQSSTFWKHDVGRACYLLEVPPEREARR